MGQTDFALTPKARPWSAGVVPGSTSMVISGARRHCFVDSGSGGPVGRTLLATQLAGVSGKPSTRSRHAAQHRARPGAGTPSSRKERSIRRSPSTRTSSPPLNSHASLSQPTCPEWAWMKVSGRYRDTASSTAIIVLCRLARTPKDDRAQAASTEQEARRTVGSRASMNWPRPHRFSSVVIVPRGTPSWRLAFRFRVSHF